MCIGRTRILLLLFGAVSTMAAGCITGTNTFSSTSDPETRYVSRGESLEILMADFSRHDAVQPDFDIVSLRDE